MPRSSMQLIEAIQRERRKRQSPCTEQTEVGAIRFAVGYHILPRIFLTSTQKCIRLNYNALNQKKLDPDDQCPRRGVFFLFFRRPFDSRSQEYSDGYRNEAELSLTSALKASITPHLHHPRLVHVAAWSDFMLGM